MREWWEYNKPLVFLGVSALFIITLALYQIKLEKENSVKVYQDCMADIHNVYWCNIYAQHFTEYVPQ